MCWGPVSTRRHMWRLRQSGLRRSHHEEPAVDDRSDDAWRDRDDPVRSRHRRQLLDALLHRRAHGHWYVALLQRLGEWRGRCSGLVVPRRAEPAESGSRPSPFWRRSPPWATRSRDLSSEAGLVRHSRRKRGANGSGFMACRRWGIPLHAPPGTSRQPGRLHSRIV